MGIRTCLEGKNRQVNFSRIWTRYPVPSPCAVLLKNPSSMMAAIDSRQERLVENGHANTETVV